MKILYYGGQKSGKSRLAEHKVLDLHHRPTYIATYDNRYGDLEMQRRVDNHRQQRQEKFITIEEPLDLIRVIQPDHTYLIDCLSMWILNTLEYSETELLQQLETICRIDADIVFVLNEVTLGIIPIDEESRTFVDRMGIVGQYMAQRCDEVYEVKLGLTRRWK